MDTDSIISILISDSFFSEGTVDVFQGVLIGLIMLFAAFVTYSQAVLAALNPVDLNTPEFSSSQSGQQLLHLKQNPARLIIIFTSIKAFLFLFSLILAFLLFPVTIYTGLEAVGFTFLIVIIISILYFFVCEAIPQSLPFTNPQASLAVAKGVVFVDFLARPAVAVFEVFLKLRRSISPDRKQEVSLGDLSRVMDLTTEEINEGKELLEGIIRFNDKMAVEIMTPREDMTCLDISVQLSEITHHVVEMRYSRIPIYDKSEDNIRGVLYVKDLLPFIGTSGYRWQQLIRPAYFVPETKKIDVLLKEFRSNKIHMAVVVDEYGGTSGLVTMEDILEEIVGEIEDEYDDNRKPYVQLADGSLIFEGKTLLTDFFRIVGVDESEFEELTGDVDTLAGLILELKGDFPRRQEIITYGRYQLQVLEMSKRRIVKVKYSVVSPKENEE